MEYGRITLEQVSRLIQQNLTRAKEVGLRIVWGYNKNVKAYYSRIYDGERICHEEYYSGKLTHLIIAELHDDLARNLLNVAQAKKRALYLKEKERELERREMENRQWRNRI